MPSASATRASDKQNACRKLTSLLQKDYGRNMPKLDLPVLETMLFAACLEDNDWQQAQDAYDRMLRSFFDLNEIRVSSVAEIENVLTGLNRADMKGMYIRAILRFVFESNYSFEFEKLRRLTLESAHKRLKKIDMLSPFIRNFTLQQVLGCHIVCLDSSSLAAAVFLGLVPADSDEESAGEFLKAGVKKSDAHAFAYLLRCLATDPKNAGRFNDIPEGELDVSSIESRLKELKSPPKKRSPAKPPVAEKTKKTTTKKKPPASPATGKSAARKTRASAAQPAKKKTARKPAPKKTAARKK